MPQFAIEIEVTVRDILAAAEAKPEKKKIQLTVDAPDAVQAVNQLGHSISMQYKKDWAPPPPKFGVKNP